MAIIGTHLLLYTADAESLRATLRDAFGFNAVDAGGGWLIFALPPAELGVHPAEGPAEKTGGHHQISFMCDDIGKTMAQLRAKGVQFEGEPAAQDWGTVAMMNLPGGVKVMLYQPRHALAIAPAKPKAAHRGTRKQGAGLSPAAAGSGSRSVTSPPRRAPAKRRRPRRK